MHDIGKSETPKEILNKPGQLTPEEFEVMKQHVMCGEKIMTESHGMNLDDIIAMSHHHERINGQGYPRGLKMEQIHVHGRIVGIVDCFDAMTTRRTYQNAMGAFEAMQLMKGKLANSFDQSILNHLIALLVKS
jgi:HD-GYP domain-containing protein (c-di-GMP phosphodiesterase class II)